MASLKTRLFLELVIKKNQIITLSKEHIHFLTNVLRLRVGDEISIFNSRSGEWLAQIMELSKKVIKLHIKSQLKFAQPEPGPWLAFAPIKKNRTDFLVEKATELGVERLIPVITRFTGPRQLNINRLTLIAVEAAEQCRRISIPAVNAPITLSELIHIWPKNRRLYFGDETGNGLLTKNLSMNAHLVQTRKYGFFIGPEGGFSDIELSCLNNLEYAQGIDLGPRLLRSETAAIAMLVLWQILSEDKN